MDKNQILVFSAIAAALAIRLYRKYRMKDKIKSGPEGKVPPSTSFPTSSKDEEYEPYSKK
jgi:hypothetical protein